MGTLTAADVDRFAQGCVALVQYQEALRLVGESGLLGVGQKGADVPAASLTVLERCETRFDRFCARFGFDPSSRSQLKGNPPSVDTAEDFLTG